MVITNKRKEQLRNASKRWRKNHPERVKARQKRWDKNHPDYKKNYTKKWRQENPEKYKNQPSMSLEKRRITVRKYRKNIRIKIFELLGNKCIRCGETDWRCLQVDHVNNDGYNERKKIRGSWAYYKHILEKIKLGSKDYQLLCANCNWKKRYENEYEQKELK